MLPRFSYSFFCNTMYYHEVVYISYMQQHLNTSKSNVDNKILK